MCNLFGNHTSLVVLSVSCHSFNIGVAALQVLWETRQSILEWCSIHISACEEFFDESDAHSLSIINIKAELYCFCHRACSLLFTGPFL